MNSESHVQKGKVRVQVGGQLVLEFELAARMKRAFGFAIDSMTAFTITNSLFIFKATAESLSALLVNVLVLIFSILSPLLTVYSYAYFEYFFGGRSPGKSSFGLAVLSRDGGPLTLKQIFTRNFLKWFQVWLPIIVLIQYAMEPDDDSRGAGESLRVLIASSLLLFNLVPLFRKDRASVGDLLANTLVVCLPRPFLLPDLGPTAATKQAAKIAAAGPEIRFTKQQLEIYGVYELETLEDVIRRGSVVHNAKELIDVANTIARRIGWQPDPGSKAPAAIDFLRAFYGEQRRALEDLKRLGRHRERQAQLGPKTPPPPPRV